MSEEWGDLGQLRVLGECLADAKKARVSAENRAKRGYLIAAGDSDIQRAEAALQTERIVAPARKLEEAYAAELLEAYKFVVPDHVRAWAADIPGLASGTRFPRIIAATGHPRVAEPKAWGTDAKGKKAAVAAGDPFERTLRQFWQYCGCGDPMTNPRGDILGHSPTREDKLRGGKRETVRPLLYDFTSYLVRMHTTNEKVAQSWLYQAFEQARKQAEQKVHARQCQNKARPPMAPNGCGTVAHPEWGEPGSPWRPGHCNMHAHRIAQKEFLRQLWIEAGK